MRRIYLFICVLFVSFIGFSAVYSQSLDDIAIGGTSDRNDQASNAGVRFTIFPNPVKSGGILTIRTDVPVGEQYTVQISNIIGKRLLFEEFEGGRDESITLYSNAFPKGLYIVQLKHKETQNTLRLNISQ